MTQSDNMEQMKNIEQKKGFVKTTQKCHTKEIIPTIRTYKI